MLRDRSVQAFVGAVAIIGAGFLGSTFYAEMRAAAIDRDAANIGTNAMPSVTHLVAARSALRHIEVAAERFARAAPPTRESTRHALSAARSELYAALAKELQTDNYPDEEAAARAAQRDVDHLDELLDQWLASPPAEGDADDDAIHQAVDATDRALQAWLALNARQGQEAVARIIAVRQDSMRVALGLDVASIALALAALAVALVAVRRTRATEAEHAKLLAERAEELETFAKRVAHDLLSPLSALTFSLQAFKKVAANDSALGDALVRSRTCVTRAQTMVDGIFEFARAGAHPGSGGRAQVRETVDQVLDEVRSMHGETEVVVEGSAGGEVACRPGVLLSIVSNLVRNAVKYMSDSAMKRVTVRLATEGEQVRVEVEDTGPGVPEGMTAKIFDPYVRADGLTQPGLGLGLATVKRLCEAHGGSVGVRSTRGRGSVFWFTLPTPPRAEDDDVDATSSRIVRHGT